MLRLVAGMKSIDIRLDQSGLTIYHLAQFAGIRIQYGVSIFNDAQNFGLINGLIIWSLSV